MDLKDVYEQQLRSMEANAQAILTAIEGYNEMAEPTPGQAQEAVDFARKLRLAVEVAAGFVDMVPESHACPNCGNRLEDYLLSEDGKVTCQICGQVYAL